MKAEREIGRDEWLLGSTILCQSCGCLWLVPATRSGDTYHCRQCGSEVTTENSVADKDELGHSTPETFATLKRTVS